MQESSLTLSHSDNFKDIQQCLNKIDSKNEVNQASVERIESFSKELQLHRQKIIEKKILNPKDAQVDKVVSLFNKIVTDVNDRLGASAVETVPLFFSAKALKKFLEHDPHYQALSKEEKEFINQLTPKNLGHLFGDSFILGMVDQWGAPIEGNSLPEAMKFFLVSLKYLSLKYPDKFKDKTDEIVKTIKIIKDSLKNFELLNQMISEDNLIRKKEYLDDYVKEIINQIDSIKEGETILLPWGWSDPSKIGHAVILSITKKGEELYIEVINTGAGIEFNDSPNDPSLFKSNTISHYRITGELRREFYQNTLPVLFEPLILGGMDGIDSPMYSNQGYSAKELYMMLEKYRYTPEKEAQTHFLKGAQQSGTCSFQCLLAFFGKMTEGFDRDLKFLWEQEAMTHLLDFHDLFSGMDPVYEIYLSRLNPNLFRHLEKLSDKELSQEERSSLLQLFEEDRKKIEALSKPYLETNPSLPDLAPQWVVPKMSELISDKASASKGVTALDENRWLEILEQKHRLMLPLFAGDLAKWEPEQWVEALRQKRKIYTDKVLKPTFNSFWGLFKKNQPVPVEFLLFENCREIAAFFIDPRYQAEKALFLEKCQKDPQLLEQLLEEFSLWAVEANNNVLKTLDIAHSVVLEGFRLAIYDLAVLRDNQLGYEGVQRMDHYPLRFELALELLPLSLCSFNTAQAERDYEMVKKVYQERFPNQNRPLCFLKSMELKESQNTLEFLYDSKIPDFQYAAAFVSFLSEEDLKKAHEEYLEFLKVNSRLYNTRIKESDWLICWIYTQNKLPIQYRALLNATFAVYLSSADSNLRKSLAPQIELVISASQTHRNVPLITTNISKKDQLLYRETTKDLSPDAAFMRMDPKNSVKDFNTFPFYEEAQNNGMAIESSQLKEIVSIASVSHPLQISMVLDYYRQSPELLNQAEHQVFFEGVLFSPSKLSSALKKNPALAQDIIRFFEEINKQILSKKIKLIESEEIISFQSFILEQKVRCYQSLKTAEFITQKDLIKERGEIQKLLDTQEIHDNEVLARLHLAWIGTFDPMDSWNPEDIISVLSQFQNASQMIKGINCKKIGFESFLRATKIILVHLEEIVNFLNSKQSKEWVESLLPGQTVLEWNVEKFPLLIVKTTEGVQILHLFAGVNFTERKETTVVPEGFLQIGLYQIVFNKERVRGQKGEDFWKIEHPTGNYTIRTQDYSIASIEKQIEGKSYTLTSYLDLKMHFIPEIENWQLWVSNSGNPSLTLIYDKTGFNKLGFINEEGIVHLYGPPSCSYKYSQKNQWNDLPFFQMCQPILLTQKVDDSGKVTEELKLKFASTNFFKVGNRWYYEQDPNYFIAEEQKILGCQLYHKFLILKNNQGKKIALIPELTHTELKTGQPKKFSFQCLTIDLIKDHEIPVQSSPYKNSFIAYQLMMNAKKPEHYLAALKFLKGVQEFRPYTDVELKMLGLIVFSDRENQNDDPEAYAIRLYAAYHIFDNLRHYPRQETIQETYGSHTSIPEAKDDKQIWSVYLQKILIKPIYAARLDTMLHSYVRKRNNLANELKIEKFVPTQDLEEWGWFSCPMYFHSREKLPSFSPLPLVDQLIQNGLSIGSKASTGFPPFLTRPGSLKPYFYTLYEHACSSELESRQKVFNFLDKSRFDDNWENKQMRSILVIVLEAKNPNSKVNKKANEVINILGKIFDDQGEKRYYFDRLEKLYHECLKGMFADVRVKKIMGEPYYIPSKTSPLELSAAPNQVPLPYHPDRRLFDPFQAIAASYFLERPQISDQPEAFFEEKMAEVKGLNEEYEAGYKQNLEKRSVATQGDPLEVKQKLLERQSEIVDLYENDQKELNDLAQKIVEVGNRYLRETIKGRTQVGGGKRKALSCEDLILLCLQSNPKKIKKATRIKKNSDLRVVIGLIGNYLELEMRVRHSQSILAAFKDLAEATPHTLSESLRAVQDLLEAPYKLVQHKNPLIQLAFQHFLDMNFYPYQVAGLDQMVNPDQDCFLQAATGAGKSLIFAHSLAFYKADGYHLSIHVSPTYQFASQIYEMSDRSKAAFGQTARALIFQDSPEYFNADYLKLLNQDMIRMIQEGEYFNTTVTTLRTLRTAYIHSALEYYNNPDRGDWQYEEELATKMALVREVNAKIRMRGRLTFDEVHDAQNPKVILNKGVGETTRLNDVHIELMALMLRLSAPLIALKDNKQAQASADDQIKLAQTIVQHLTTDKAWLQKLECEQLTGEEMEQLRYYLLEKEAEAPPFLQKRIDTFERKGNVITSLDHLLLCRQLLAGRWLFESLSRSVYEHHGIIYQQNQLPLSIPFTANLKPSKNSEFSDPYRMGLNTLIAYHVQGLNQEQTKDLIEHCRMNALKEYEEKIEFDYNYTLRDTEAYRQFSKIIESVDPQLSLFEVNLNNPQQLLKIGTALKAPEHAAMVLLSDYVAVHILKRKSLVTKQISCNGMNTATMGKNVNGFSATIDNSHIAPTMDYKGRKITVETEKGIYGQRVDLLIRKHPSVYVMGNEPQDLFRDVFRNLPDEKRKKVRAIIDPGCHFRGIRNEEVAAMMCKEMRDLPIQGVIFYDHETDRPYFKLKDTPAVVKPVASFKTIDIDGVLYFKDLNIPVDEVAVFFSQDKATGTNIPLMKDAVAISTVTENSHFSSKVQGDGRMRGMSKQQEIVTAIQKGALEKASQVLDKSALNKLKTGLVQDPEMIKDVILFTYCLRAKEMKEENYILCMQNIQNIVQQHLLDKIYENSALEEDIFVQCAHLFEEDIAIDLVRDYGIPKIALEKEKYLNLTIEKLMQSLQLLQLPAEEIAILQKTLESVKREFLPDLEATIPVTAAELNSTQLVASKQHRDQTMVQVQEKKAVKVQEQLNVNTWISEGMGESRVPSTETPITEEVLFAKEFGEVSHRPKKDVEFVEEEANEDKSAKAILKEILKFLQAYPKGKLIEPKIQKMYPDFSLDVVVDFLYPSIEDAFRVYNILKGILPKNEIAPLNKIIEPFKYLTPKSQVSLNSLEEALKNKFSKSWKVSLFSQELLATENFLTTMKYGVNLQDEKQKPIFQVLIVQDEALKQTKAILLSAADAEHIAQLFEGDHSLPEGRKMWLLRPVGDLAWPGPTPYDKKNIINDPHIRRLLTQVNFFAGNLHILEQPQWQKALKEWLETVEHPQFAKSFFENSILRNTPKEDYYFSRTKKTLQEVTQKHYLIP